MAGRRGRVPPLGVEMPEGVTRRHCVECGVGFEPYSRAEGYQKYCSHRCRTKAWREPVKKSRSRLVLERLRESLCTALELQMAGGGTAATSRVRELRHRGYVIECDRTGDVPLYRLISEPRGD